MKKFAFVRADKIGDLLLNLPVDQIPELKGSDITWIINNKTESLFKLCLPVRRYFSIDLEKPKDSFWKLFHFFKAEKFDGLLQFYGVWWISLAALTAGISTRFGRYSQWSSFFFFNKGIRQKRSLSEKHELEYNLEMLSVFLDLPKPRRVEIFKDVRAKINTQHFFADTGISEALKHKMGQLKLTEVGYYVVHAGMFGSALNWPQKKYIELIEILKFKHPVILTGTAIDEPYLDQIITHFKNDPLVISLVNQLSFSELITILRSAKACVAPSTGVMHIAALLQVPTYSLFSPVRSHLARRWGPLSLNSMVFAPEMDAQDCMSQISAPVVAAEIIKL